MKTFLKLIFILTMVCAPHSSFAENEYLTQELLNTPQENEIPLLSDEDDALIDGIEQNGEILDINFYKNVDDDDDDDITDNVEEEFKLFDMLGKNNKPMDEKSLLNKVLSSKIVRTDIPTFLLKDELTFNYKKGPIREAQFFTSYRGRLNLKFYPHHNTTDYETISSAVGMYGKLNYPDLDFKISFLPVPKSGENYIDTMWGDLYLMTSKIPNHKIVLGRSRGQIGIEGGNSSYTLPFLNRSQIARNFGNMRTTSVKVIGNYNYADYSFAFGSSGRYFTSGMPGTDFTGWINFKPFGSKDAKLGKLTVGTGINRGHNRFNYNVGTVYIGYKHKKLWTNFEASIADGYNGSVALSKNKAAGFAYTAGWKFIPQLQLIVRYDQFDPNRNISNDLRREYSVGINWFIKGQALKFVLNYVFCENQSLKDSQKIILGTQILL